MSDGVSLFRHEAGRSVTIYPLVCLHIGAPQADLAFIRQHVARIAADPDGRYVYLGDGGECVTKASKGELYEQTASPDRQIDIVADLLEPIRGKGLFGISGNHDRRIAKLSGLDWTKALCAQLGIPYLGLAAMARFTLSAYGRSLAWDTFWHHGADSSAVLGGKLNAAKKLEHLAEVDAVFSAHSHIALDAPPTYRLRLDPQGRRVSYREVRNFICGCAYDSTVPGYAMEKGYPPILPAWAGITLRVGKRKVGDVSRFVRETTCHIYRKEVA